MPTTDAYGNEIPPSSETTNPGAIPPGYTLLPSWLTDEQKSEIRRSAAALRAYDEEEVRLKEGAEQERLRQEATRPAKERERQAVLAAREKARQQEAKLKQERNHANSERLSKEADERATPFREARMHKWMGEDPRRLKSEFDDLWDEHIKYEILAELKKQDVERYTAQRQADYGNI
jgi:hypothetical protein